MHVKLGLAGFRHLKRPSKLREKVEQGGAKPMRTQTR